MTIKNLTEINSISELNNKILSIQVSLNGLSFSTINSDNSVEKSETLRFPHPLSPLELDQELQQLLEQHQLLEEHFAKIQIIHDNELSNFVPQPYFNEEHLSDYLKYANKIFETDYISFDEIETSKMINVYIPFVNINNFIVDHFGDFEYKHSSTIILEHLLHIAKEKQCFYVLTQESSFQLFAFSNENLVLHNTFSYQTKEDFIYYILFTAEQLQFSAEEFFLNIIDDITEEHDLFEIAYTYVRNVKTNCFQSSFHQHITAKNLELLYI
ncbi:DUF3822 family protein [Zhouia sp. PK063]|uniref:DUF3822 family protein n=1 Tax=Zhouia sp. PK063 TaxID=3373602 RepID=UPI003792DD09